MMTGGERVRRVVRASEGAMLALATLGFIAFVVVSGLASSPNADRFGFKNTTAGISNEFVTQVTPAGFTFAIWGLIFIWQSAWLAYAWTYQCRPEAVHTISTSTYTWFTIGSVINIFWLYLFGNELINWSSVFLAGFDVAIYITIAFFAFTYFSNYSSASKIDDVLTKVLVLNGLSLYATWTTIAGLVNFSIVLQYTFSVDPSTVGTVALALLSAVILLYFTLENTILYPYARSVFTVYPVVIWALIGVLDKHWGVQGEERNAIFTLIILFGTVALAFLRTGLLVIFYHFRQQKVAKEGSTS